MVRARGLKGRDQALRRHARRGARTVGASIGAETAGAETSTPAENPLYGCIEQGTASPLIIKSTEATLDAAVFGKGSICIDSEHGTALYGGPAAERVRAAVDRFLKKAAS